LLGDQCLLGQVGQPTAAGRDPLEDPRLCRREVVVTLRSQGLEDPCFHRPVGDEEQQSGVQLFDLLGVSHNPSLDTSQNL
jgi:hypothetical protein